MKVTIVGAGKTGRGFIARLMKDNEISFIDKDSRLIGELNEDKVIKISYFGDKKPEEKITFSSAKTWEDTGKINADLIFVSVGGNNLSDVGAELKSRIKSGQKIIVCENASDPAGKLYKAIGIEGIEIAESTVFCTTIEKSGIDINSEWYPYLQYNADAFKSVLPGIIGLKPVKNFGNFLNRKLFTYNSASCIIAYLGYLKGYTVYSDAANDKDILAMLDKNYEIINCCMCKEYGYDEKDQEEFAKLSRDKFTDVTLVDTVARNAREPQRKITRHERVVGPLLLEEKYGKDTSVLEKTLAAMILYTPEEETEWKKILEEKGYEAVLSELAGLDKNGAIFKRIIKMVENGEII